MLRKIMIGSTALALVAGTVAIPSKADAHVWWVWPALAGTALGGFVVGTAAANNGGWGNGFFFGDPGPAGGPCHIGREQAPDGTWHRVRVCP